MVGPDITGFSANSPSPQEVTMFHRNSDKDSSVWAQHHTLGKNPNQAAPGDHGHKLVMISKTSVYVGSNVGVAPNTQTDMASGLIAIPSDAQTYRVVFRGKAVSAGDSTLDWFLLENGVQVDVHTVKNYADINTDLDGFIVYEGDATLLVDTDCQWTGRCFNRAASPNFVGTRDGFFTIQFFKIT